jgi:hypothetical protein
MHFDLFKLDFLFLGVIYNGVTPFPFSQRCIVAQRKVPLDL